MNDTIKTQRKKEVKTMKKQMYFFEILNTKTNARYNGVGYTMRQACESCGQQIKECKCISRNAVDF